MRIHPSFARSLTLTLVTLAALAVTTLTPTAAHAAEGAARGIGIGATRTLAGVNGATFVYDASAFHIVGLLGFQSVDQDPGDDLTAFAIGGQFLFHAHVAAQADFSVGGGLTIVSIEDDGDANDETNFHIEGLAQIRAFIVPNVALSASLGLLIALGDDFVVTDGSILAVGNGDSAIALGGQVSASVGLTYFF